MSGTSLFDEIRAACARVAAQARHVRIREHAIAAYARALPLEEALGAGLDPQTHYLGHGEDTAVFILALDAVNFGSGYFPHLRKRPGMSGYFTVASCLTDHFRAHGPLTARALAAMRPEDCVAVFGQQGADPAICELMQRFATAFQQLGRILLDEFGGSAAALIEAAGHSAERLVRLLARMPYLDDVQTYGALRVPFYKRGQLTAADLALAFGREGLGRFDDLYSLTMFADNLVPHVLRVDGILHYDAALAARIGAGELIPAGSAEEIEIRAAGLHAVELIATTLRQAGDTVTAMQLDYLLWNRGQLPAYKAIPRHRTRTVFY